MKPALLIAALAAAVFLPSVLVGEFLHLDDDHYVIHSPAVSTFDFARALNPHASREDLGAEYLPVRDLTYMVDAKLFGVDSPRAFRATSLAWYALACSLAFLLLREVTKNEAVAFLAAAFFAVHPVHAESAAWIASRKDVLGGALGFAALLAHARGRTIVAVILAALAMLSKSTMLCLPLLVPLVERKLSWRVLPHLVVAALVAWNAVAVGERTGIVHPLPPGGYASIFFTDAPIVVRYLAESFVPVGLRVCYAPPFHATPDARVLVSLGVLAVFGVATLWRRELRLPAAWFALSLAPVLNLQPGAQWIADRYLFFPLLGVTLLVARVLVRIASRAPHLSVALASLLLASLAALGVARGIDFTTDEHLFRQNIRWEPDDPIAHHQLGFGLLAKAQRGRDAGKTAMVAPIAHAAEVEELEAVRLAARAAAPLGPRWHFEVRRSLAEDLALQEKWVEETRLRLDLIRSLDPDGTHGGAKLAEELGHRALAHAKGDATPRDLALLIEAARCYAVAGQVGLARSTADRVSRVAPDLVDRAAAEDPDLARALR